MSKTIARLKISRIRFQKDEFKSRDDGPAMDIRQFLEGDDMEADLVGFKRIRAEGRVEAEGSWGFKVIVSLRGDAVTITVDDACPWGARGIYWALERHLTK